MVQCRADKIVTEGRRIERRALSKALLPHVRRFYAGYFDAEAQ